MSSTETGASNRRGLRDRSTIKKPKRFIICLKHGHHSSTNAHSCSENEQDRGELTDNSFSSPLPRKKIKSEESKYDPKAEESGSNKENSSKVRTKDEENDYAAMVAKNIQAKMAFLEALNIPEAKRELGILKEPQKRGISVKKLKAVPDDNTPKRISKRLQRLAPDGAALPDEPKPKSYMDPYLNDPYKILIPRLPTTNSLGLKQTCKITNIETVETFLSTLSEELQQPVPDNITYSKQTMHMVNNEHMIAKVVPDRIYSLAVYPDLTSRQLVAAGDRKGHLGIWDVGSMEAQDGVYLFRPCHDSINCLIFETGSLLCGSYEGTLKRFDMRSGEFQHLYATPENLAVRCSHFDKMSEHCYIISTSEGTVITIDTRTPGTDEELEMVCHPKPVKTVHVHPLQKEYFLTASNDGTTCLWDVRCHKELSPVAQVSQKRSVNCAYFSPVSGNSFVTCSYNDTVKVYDCSTLGPKFKETSSIHHDNQVGRWVTPFRAQWLPNSDNLYAIGSKRYPRDVGVHNALSGRKEHSFSSSYLGSIVPIITFHPKLPFLAGGNSSGKVYVFKNEVAGETHD